MCLYVCHDVIKIQIIKFNVTKTNAMMKMLALHSPSPEKYACADPYIQQQPLFFVVEMNIVLHIMHITNNNYNDLNEKRHTIPNKDQASRMTAIVKYKTVKTRTTTESSIV